MNELRLGFTDAGEMRVIGEVPEVIHFADDLVRDADGTRLSVADDLLTFHCQPRPLMYRRTMSHPLLVGISIAERVRD